MAAEIGTRLPWVEKYRPQALSDVCSHEEIVKTLNRWIETNQLPHMLFYGPPGTGKTTSILAVARSLFSEKQRNSMVLELNASDDRGINVVRDEIVTFAQTKGLHSFGGTAANNDSKTNVKLVILDEADAMTKDAQNALRRIIEKYTENVRFCIICNYLSNIIPAIQSRCTRFRFAPLNPELVRPRIDFVAEKESVEVTTDGKEALLALSGGDMRRVLNVLQAASMAFGKVDADAVYACVGQPTPKEMEGLLRILLNDNFATACKKVEKDFIGKGYALADVITRLHDDVYRMHVPNDVTAGLVIAMANTEQRLAVGCSDRIQTAGLVSAFIKARARIAEYTHPPVASAGMNNQGAGMNYPQGQGGQPQAGGAGPGQPGQQYAPPQGQPGPGQQFPQQGYYAGYNSGVAPGAQMYGNSPQYARGNVGPPAQGASGGQGYGGYYQGPSTGPQYMQQGQPQPAGGQPQPAGGQPQAAVYPGMQQQPPQQAVAPPPSQPGQQQQQPAFAGALAGAVGGAPPPNTSFGLTPTYTTTGAPGALAGAQAYVPPPTAGGLPGSSGTMNFGGTVPAPTTMGVMSTHPIAQQPRQPSSGPVAGGGHMGPTTTMPAGSAAPSTAMPAASSAMPGAAQPQQQQQASSSSATATKQVPNPYSAEVLNHLEKYSVPDLCAIGRELVADLNYRTSVLCHTLKSVSERKPYQFAPEPQLDYCQMLLKKIVEIRLRIESNMPKKRITADDFIEMMREPGEPVVSARVREQEEMFAANREKLITLSSDLKMLDWLAQVADPSHLKKTDALKTTKERERERENRPM